jgi:hypothetical protein
MTFDASDDAGGGYMPKHDSNKDETRIIVNLSDHKKGRNNDQCKQLIYNATTTSRSDCLVNAITIDKLCLFEELYEAHRSLCIQKLTGLQVSTERRFERKVRSTTQSSGNSSSPKRNRTSNLGLYSMCANHLRDSGTGTITTGEMASLRQSCSFLNDVDEHRKTRLRTHLEDHGRQHETNSTLPEASSYVTNASDRRQSNHYDLECPDIRDSGISALTLDDWSILEDLYNQNSHYSLDYSTPNLNVRELDNVNEEEEYVIDLNGIDENN